MIFELNLPSKLKPFSVIIAENSQILHVIILSLYFLFEVLEIKVISVFGATQFITAASAWFSQTPSLKYLMV